MIYIRSEQLEIFNKKAHHDYESELVDHLKTFAPQHARGMGDDGLRKLIQSGLSQAQSYGWTLRGSSRFFIECQVMFGHQFDSDPQLPWVKNFFGSKTRPDNELAWADQAHAAAIKYRDEVAGFQNEIEIAAIQKLIRKPAQEWLSGDLSDAMTEKMLSEVYPEKAILMPKNAFSKILRKGHEFAIATQLPSDAGARVVSALMVAFGHGVMTDSQFPWISECLTRILGLSSENRAELLLTKTIAYLSFGLKRLGNK